MNEAIHKVLYPYIHRQYRKRFAWPKLRPLLQRVYPQVDGGRVLEIRIHEKDLIAARREFEALLSSVKKDITFEQFKGRK